MKKIFIIAGSIFLVVIIILAYFRISQNSIKGSDVLLKKQADDIFLYHRFTEKMLAYNTKNYISNNIVLDDQVFYYSFNDINNDIFTVGHSINNNFKLVKVESDDYKILYQLPEDEGIFPLAKNDNIILLIHYFYNKDGKEKKHSRKISLYDMKTNNLIDYKFNPGLVMEGILINNCLYYSAYNSVLDNYDIYKFDMNVDKEPKLVENNVQSKDIFNLKGKLITSTENDILLSPDFKVKKEYLNYFLNDDMLLQMYLSKDNFLSLKITNINDKNIMLNINNIIDFRIENETIVIYKNGSIIKYKLNTYLNEFEELK